MAYKTRLARGLKTPSWQYYRPIAMSIVERGGSAFTCDLYDAVKEKMADVLNHYDYCDVPNNARPEPRWMNTMRVARDEMVKAGLLKSPLEVDRGVWAITEKCREQYRLRPA